MKFKFNALQKCLCLVLLFACVLGVATSAFAQSAATGTITGTVTDKGGAVVPNATVKIVNTDTGAVRVLTTNGAGNYVSPFQQPGHYSVTTSAPSFTTSSRKNLILTVGETLTIDAALVNGETSTIVEVTTQTPLLDTDKVESSQTIGERLISNLPVNGRNWSNFVLLTPNVVPDGTSGLISYRGVSGLYNSNFVDGANNNQAFFAEARGRAINVPYVYSVDAIKEFESSSAAYSAEFGQAAGGQVNAITKSGTNALHGDLFYSLRYPALNALDPFSKYQALHTGGSPLLLTQPVHQQQQFGGSVGGPIIKDKLFYFFTYDGFRKVYPIFYLSSYNTSTTNVGSLAHLCDGGPTNVTTKVGTTTYVLPTTITGISTGQCSTALAYIQNQLLGSFPRATKQDIFFPRLDYQFNAKNHFSTSFNWENYHTPNGYNAANTVSNGSVTQNGTANFHERFYVANWESLLTSRSANVVHFQWSRDLETDSTNSPGPAMSLTNLVAYGETNALPRPSFPDEHRWQITDVYSTTIGKHSIKAGGDLNLVHEQVANLFQGDGNFTYGTGTTEFNFTNWIQDVYRVGNGVVGNNQVNRHYDSFTQVKDPVTGIGADDFWMKYLDFFAEDSWKVTQKLVVNLGIRYDTQFTPQPDLPNTLNPLTTKYTSTINTNLHMIQPRVGFAWQAYPGTVLRGGYGLFYGMNQGSTYYTLRRENGVAQQQFNINPTTKPDSPYALNGTGGCVATGAANSCLQQSGAYGTSAPVGGNPIFTPPGPPVAAPFPGAATPVVIDTTAGSGTATALSPRGLDPHFTQPYSHEFDLTVEQVLPFHSTLTLAYVGNRAQRLPIYIDTNLDPASRVTRLYHVTPITGGAYDLPSAIYTARLYNNVSTMLTGFSTVNSWYHSGVATFKKPFSHGVEMLMNYTWARAMDGAQVNGSNGTFNGTDPVLDPANFKDEYGRSDLDVRGRFVGSVVWTPVLSFVPKYVGYGVNGWSLAGSYTAQTGVPVTANLSSSPTAAYNTTTNAGDGGLTGAVVSLNASGTPGRVPTSIARRNAFAGPGIHNLDMRVSRDFHIYNSIRFQILGEAFNIVNHRNIFAVNTSLYSATSNTATSTTCPTSTYSTAAYAGCITPATSSLLGSTNSTSSTLYGARQLQVGAKLFF